MNATEVINDRLHAAWQGVLSGQLPFLGSLMDHPTLRQETWTNTTSHRFLRLPPLPFWPVKLTNPKH
jgi:hypothetical protein